MPLDPAYPKERRRYEMLLCPLTGLLLLGVETVKEKGGMQRMKSWDVSVIRIVVVSDSPLNQRMKDEG